ncbi:Putative Sas10/Utp3 family protein [Aspergillus calidoustus]|uniref:Putative Sas10/Utp3 family protein n=1 Tax=Aspergillus calidoustus TaxID=454130 RepID=A0A0U5GU05_ASPCI|nr:Putative Sas10/Utp3 family protein [Aspergillus calidoustus]
MGKKRKAGGRPAANKTPEEENYKFDVEERFDDSADEFQTGRDQVLLEEAPEAKRRRKLAEEEEALQPSDEEILGYESFDEELDEDDDMDDEDDLDQFQSKKKRGASPGSGDEDEEGIAAWGSSRKDFYNADQIETEADALEEEEEAKRLQQKHLQEINEEDFGFDEEEWAESGKGPEEAKAEAGEVTEVLPQLEITDDMGTEEKLKILKSRYPEFEPLAKDFVDLQPTHQALAEAAKAAKQDDVADHAPVTVVKYRALSAYLGAISMYFMLLTSAGGSSDDSTTVSPAQLRSHPVMTSLVNFRKLWDTVKDITPVEVKPRKDISEIESDMEMDTPEVITTESKKTKATKTDKKERKPTRAERAAEAARAEAEARRAKRLEETEANLAGLSNLVTAPGRKRVVQKAKGPSKDADDSDFGDEDALTTKEAEEKAKQKRSLRFYTSQIAQKSNKRSAAGRDAGGDADIPYRERLRDRQARLNAEAERRGKQKPQGAEELGGDSDEEDHRVRKELRGNDASGSDDDDYYDMVAARTNKRKGDKKEAYEAAAREGGRVEIQEEIGPDGKRAITYQIEKNRGLAPKRNKLNRNPRVKKRMRFEAKKKKLSSVRQVYKGGEGAGGYGGELTGIKKNLVKSVKL